MSEVDLAMRDMDAAEATAHACRIAASENRQSGFHEVAAWNLENAKAAERWLVLAAKAYPERVSADGKKARTNAR